jgi:hypothetical protein
VRDRLFSSALVGLALLAGCGGGGPKTDSDAVAQVLKDAVKAGAKGEGDKACGFLTPDAQRQAVLQTGLGVLGDTDCATAVKRVQFVLTPLDKKRLESLEPANVAINGTAASATMATSKGLADGQAISVEVNLQKVGSDWKISGFSGQQGLPSG